VLPPEVPTPAGNRLTNAGRITLAKALRENKTLASYNISRALTSTHMHEAVTLPSSVFVISCSHA